jgi:predicted hydrocarbon binding protein
MEDVMGQQGLKALLEIASLVHYINNPPPDTLAREFDFRELSRLHLALEEMYGVRGGRGMALRIGRAVFSRGLRHFGAMQGVVAPAFQVLALEHRSQIGLHGLASIFTNFTDQNSSLEIKDNHFLFHVQPSPFAWGRTSDKPVCHALVGILQESLRWFSNGYEYYAQEISCQASGADACVFQINKAPMGQSSTKQRQQG